MLDTTHQIRSAAVRFWTLVRTQTFPNRTHGPVPGSSKTQNRTSLEVRGSGDSWTGSNSFEPQNFCVRLYTLLQYFYVLKSHVWILIYILYPEVVSHFKFRHSRTHFESRIFSDTHSFSESLVRPAALVLAMPTRFGACLLVFIPGESFSCPLTRFHARWLAFTPTGNNSLSCLPSVWVSSVLMLHAQPMSLVAVDTPMWFVPSWVGIWWKPVLRRLLKADLRLSNHPLSMALQVIFRVINRRNEWHGGRRR